VVGGLRTFDAAQGVLVGMAGGLARRKSERIVITRSSISLTVLFLATTMSSAATEAFASKPPVARPLPRPVAPLEPRSAVVLRDFLLKPSGILFGMHPTEARIMITAAAAAPLKVCQFGTTFSTHWKGGCRRLFGRPMALPTSGGAVHIGFRVLPSNGRPTRVTAFRLRWHCVDHYFGLLRGKTVVRSASPIFDC
jgi:hypothetical protein